MTPIGFGPAIEMRPAVNLAARLFALASDITVSPISMLVSPVGAVNLEADIIAKYVERMMQFPGGVGPGFFFIRGVRP